MVSDDALLVEQRGFYRADAESFDEWLSSLVAEQNNEPTAVAYRAGLAKIATIFEDRAPLGRTLEIAAGTGRLAEIYAAHAESVMLLDASPESLAFAVRRLDAAGRNVTVAEADVFEWAAQGQIFDAIVFSAWLHHVPHSRFDDFWGIVESRLAPGGEVLFDFLQAAITPHGKTEIPEVPTETYSLYAPVDGVSTRDNLGRRWRVVHNLWDADELSTRLGGLGWKMTSLGTGLFDDVVLASARR